MSRRNKQKWVATVFSIYWLGCHFLSYGNQPGYAGEAEHIMKNNVMKNNDSAETDRNGMLVRDPFLPPSADCSAGSPLLRLWTLRGVVGNQSRRHGWAVKPDGSWQKLTTGDRLFADWQVTSIGPRQIDLVHDSSAGMCQVLLQSVSWSLP